MAIAFGGEALAAANYAAGPHTETLTVPGSATALLVGIASEGSVSAPSFGGITMTLVGDEGAAQLYELLDISGRADDDLDFTIPGGESGCVEAIWLEGAPIVRLDEGTGTGGGGGNPPDFPITVSLDAGSEASPLAYIAGGVIRLSASGTHITPYRASGVELSGAAFSGFPGGYGEMSYEEGCPSGAADYGIKVGGNTVGYFVAALYGEGDIILAGSRWGEKATFRAGAALVPAADAMGFALRFGEVTTFRPGAMMRAGGPRQVALVGRSLGTSEMTEGGSEGYALTWHADSKPDWQPGGGDLKTLLIDTSVSGATDVDRADAATHDLTLTGNATLTPTHSAPVAGEAIDLRLLIRQDGTGGHTLAWGGTISWVWGSAPTMPSAAGASMMIGFVSLDDGATWLAFAESEGGAGTPATTVTDETTWGITPAVGTSTDYARADHTHGSPAEPAGGAGRWEVLLTEDGSEPLTTEDGLDWLYVLVTD
jgi:hypothetical protein